MHNIPPRNNEFISFHPNRRPDKNPVIIIPTTITESATKAVVPIFNSFLNENSNPKAKRRNKTPISPHV